LAVAKRHGISELMIYKGCKRSSGFQAINIKRLTQPTSGAINLSSVSFWAVCSHRSARVAAILGYAQLSCLAPPCRRVMSRATSSCGLHMLADGSEGKGHEERFGTLAVAIATFSLVALFPIGCDQRRPL
jgi:hypothetical protein